MTEELKVLAKKLAAEEYPYTNWFRDSPIQNEKHEIEINRWRKCYLAGFEARDGMDAELLQMFKDAVRFVPPSEFRTECKELITKIECK